MNLITSALRENHEMVLELKVINLIKYMVTLL